MSARVLFGSWSAATLVAAIGCMSALSACSMGSRMGTGDGDAAVNAPGDAGQPLPDSATLDPEEDAGSDEEGGLGGDGTTFYAVGGSVSGLAGGATLTLQNNAGDDLSITADGPFAFSTPLAQAEAYAVTVLVQPGKPSQTCTVTAGEGTVDAAPVTSVTVSCVTNRFFVGGTVTGLTESMVLQNSAGDDLSIAENGSFSFATAVASGSTYNVTIWSGGQTCRVSGGTGTVVAGDVSSVTVNCTASRYTIGGTVSGLTGSGLMVANQGNDELVLSANGSFAFATPVQTATPYAVSIVAQPAGQTCTLTGGSGLVALQNITTVQVACVTHTYSVAGTLLGLADGATIVLQNNTRDDLPLTISGEFVFPSELAFGASYNVSILTQPEGQVCSVSGGSGSNLSGDVTSVVVNCVASTFVVGGSISGLNGKVVLRNNGADDLSLNANGSFAFSQPLSSGAAYDVTVQVQPSGQTCSVTNGSGDVGSSDVTSISVVCASQTFSVGGTITGLTGTLTLANNGGSLLTRNVNGEFTFDGLFAAGSVYNVTIKQQPVGQRCNVSNGVGVVGDANVSTVSVTCVSGLYSIGGAVTGLAPKDVVILENAGDDDLEVDSNGQYVFATPLPQGASYSVTVKDAPDGKKCVVTNGVGVVGTMNVVNAIVKCSPL